MGRPVRERQVMGLAAVVNAATWLGAVGVLQLAGVEVSTSLQRFGGRPLDVAWSLSLVLGWLLATAAGMVARHGTDQESAMVLERYAVLCVSIGVGVYVVTVVSSTGWVGSLVVIAFAGSLVSSLVVRQVLVRRQTRRVVREARRMAL